MYGQILVLGLAVLGVDGGWQPLPDGGYQYLIQIKPSALKSLEQGGQAAESELPPGLRGEVRSFRVTVGTEKLPQNPPLSQLDKPAPSPSPFFAPPPPSKSETAPLPLFGGPGVPEKPAPQVEPVVAKKPADESKPAAPAPEPGSGGSLWIWLIGSLVALCGSLSWNVYLLYLLKEARLRYRRLLQRTGLVQDEEEDESDEEEPEEEE